MSVPCIQEQVDVEEGSAYICLLKLSYWNHIDLSPLPATIFSAVYQWFALPHVAPPCRLCAVSHPVWRPAQLTLGVLPVSSVAPDSETPPRSLSHLQIAGDELAKPKGSTAVSTSESIHCLASHLDVLTKRKQSLTWPGQDVVWPLTCEYKTEQWKCAQSTAFKFSKCNQFKGFTVSISVFEDNVRKFSPGAW